MSKLINISNELYEKLTKIKGNDSYTITIKNLLETKNNKKRLLEFAGKGGINEKEISKIKKDWKKWSGKYA
jgi:predicted CopG family antitoxin